MVKEVGLEHDLARWLSLSTLFLEIGEAEMSAVPPSCSDDSDQLQLFSFHTSCAARERCRRIG